MNARNDDDLRECLNWCFINFRNHPTKQCNQMLYFTLFNSLKCDYLSMKYGNSMVRFNFAQLRSSNETVHTPKYSIQIPPKWKILFETLLFFSRTLRPFKIHNTKIVDFFNSINTHSFNGKSFCWNTIWIYLRCPTGCMILLLSQSVCWGTAENTKSQEQIQHYFTSSK